MPAWYDTVLERDLLPDPLIRYGIRSLIAGRLNLEQRNDGPDRLMQFAAQLKRDPIAIHTAAANAQHYEVPPRFFELVLGPQHKYSCCLWPAGVASLADAEHHALQLTAERARLADGQTILDLGCGWGSLTLYLARRFPHASLTGVSNSHSQREFILARAAAEGLNNVRIVTADMNTFEPGGRFDRVVSIEMFEHMHNYQALLARIAQWLEPAGELFVHIFSHRRYAYTFEGSGPADWMAEHFFTGGIMPADGLLAHFQDDLRIAEHWTLDGTHYQKTAEAWLVNLDAHRAEILALFARVYGEDEALHWLVRWRVFFLAVAEVWGYRRGAEWGVSHYRWTR